MHILVWIADNFFLPFFFFLFWQLAKEPNIFEDYSGLFLLAFLQIKIKKKCQSNVIEIAGLKRDPFAE